MVGWGRPLAPEILGQTDHVRANTPICNRYSLVAPQLLTPAMRRKVQLTL